jgi:hypothetical protein
MDGAGLKTGGLPRKVFFPAPSEGKALELKTQIGQPVHLVEDKGLAQFREIVEEKDESSHLPFSAVLRKGLSDA